MNKVIVINGKGGIGKDTLIEALTYAAPHFIHVTNVSSITPIVDICRRTGVVVNGEKDDAYRRLLSEMKYAVDNYYCAKHNVWRTTEYLLESLNMWRELCKVGKATHHILFVHIREPEAIDDFLRYCSDAVTLLVTNDREKDSYGNDSDDKVKDYQYRYIFAVTGTKEEEAAAFCSFVEKEILKEEK